MSSAGPESYRISSIYVLDRLRKKRMYQAFDFIRFRLAWTIDVSWSKCCLCLCLCLCLGVNQGGTNHNHCTQRLIIWHARVYKWTLITLQKPDQSDLLYWSKSPQKMKKNPARSGNVVTWENKTLKLFQNYFSDIERVGNIHELQ